MRRTIDVAVGGLSWDYSDTALTIMNPAYGLYRLFGGRSPTSGSDDDGRATAKVQDITKTEAYRGQQAMLQQLVSRGGDADTRRAQALQALQQLRAAPASSAYTPIAVSVPSFSIGEDF
jgi:hypothetical protein